MFSDYHHVSDDNLKRRKTTADCRKFNFISESQRSSHHTFFHTHSICCEQSTAQSVRTDFLKVDQPTWRNAIAQPIDHLKPDQISAEESADEDHDAAEEHATATDIVRPAPQLVGYKSAQDTRYEIGSTDSWANHPSILSRYIGAHLGVEKGYIEAHRIEEGGGQQDAELKALQQMYIEQTIHAFHYLRMEPATFPWLARLPAPMCLRSGGKCVLWREGTQPPIGTGTRSRHIAAAVIVVYIVQTIGSSLQLMKKGKNISDRLAVS